MKYVKVSPPLRFNDFKEDWKKETLCDLLGVFDGTHQTPIYKEFGTPFYSVETLTKNNFKNTKYISTDVYEKEKKKVYIEKNDVLMTRIGDIGTSKFIDWECDASFYVSLILFKTSTCDKVSGNFLKQLIESDNFQNQLWKSTIHVAFPKKINLGDVKKLKIPTPTIEEQKRIGNFLSKVDKRIKLLEELKDLKKQYKKGLLQQMFVSNSVGGGVLNVPSLRFKEFTEDWIMVKLGDLCSITTGKLNANKSVVDGKYRFYTCSKNHSQTNTFSFDEEALLIAGNGNVGHINYYKGKFDAYQRTYVLTKFNENIKFIRYSLERDLKTQVKKELKSGVMPYIVLSTLSNMKVFLPSKEEQIKISNFLKKVDNDYNKLNRELENLKKYKKSLLQRMFV